MVERAEETHARLLYNKLISHIGPANPDTEITVSGGGVNWRCVVRLAHDTCVVHCFDQRGPEYLTRFQREGEELATARTASSDDTAEAICHWLDGGTVPSLYDRFVFVDRTKRALIRIGDGVVQQVPDLQNTSELRQQGSGICSLWFRTESRSVLIYFNGKNDDPDVICHWDECPLFSFRAIDLAALGTVVKRWLCDSAMPSAMREEFPWLTIGELADYYERGNPIEGEFIESWDRIEKFYDRDQLNFRSQVLSLLGQLRQAGYDRKLRAGQSMWTFILSRSRRHGLRATQACIQFRFSSREDAMDVTVRNNNEEHTLTTSISLSDQLRAALARLLDCPID